MLTERILNLSKGYLEEANSSDATEPLTNGGGEHLPRPRRFSKVRRTADMLDDTVRPGCAPCAFGMSDFTARDTDAVRTCGVAVSADVSPAVCGTSALHR